MQQVYDVTQLRRLIDEQPVVPDKQRRTMEKMWSELIVRRNRMRDIQGVLRVLAAPVSGL